MNGMFQGHCKKDELEFGYHIEIPRMCKSVGFVTATWLLYLIIGVSFVNWWPIMEKDISKIVIVKQDPVDLEAMLKKFNLKDSDYTLIPCLRTRENEMCNILLHCCLHYFWAFPSKLLVCIHPLVFCHRFISNSSFISSFLCDLIKYYFAMVTSTHKSHQYCLIWIFFKIYVDEYFNSEQKFIPNLCISYQSNFPRLHTYMNLGLVFFFWMNEKYY